MTFKLGQFGDFLNYRDQGLNAALMLKVQMQAEEPIQLVLDFKGVHLCNIAFLNELFKPLRGFRGDLKFENLTHEHIKKALDFVILYYPSLKVISN